MILLFGFKSSGKTYWGRKLSQELALPFIDTDELIASTHNTSVRNLYQTVGEEAFRKIEHEALLSLQNHPPAVIALGGGTLLDPANQLLAQKLGTLLFLNVPWEVIESRLDPEWPFFPHRKALFEERMAIYKQIPAQIIRIHHGIE